MAKSKFSGAPIAPARVSWLLSLKLRAQGRRDAKKYIDLKDHMRTHALIVAQSKTHAGQHEVNQWLIKQVEPFKVDNSRLPVTVEDLKAELSRVLDRTEVSARKIRANLTESQEVQRKIADAEAQIQANKASIVALRLAGKEALSSWESRYEQMAALYTRARALKSKLDIASVASEVPVFKSIKLAQISDFESLEEQGRNLN